MRVGAVAILSLLFTCAFFFEYRRPFNKVHIPYDLEGFHYPLFDYAFQSLKQGRFPEWDPTTYAGLPFAANIQAALFYPPTWLLFLMNVPHERMRYGTVQDLALLHVWIGFVLAFLWFDRRKLHPMAAALGAAVYAFSGYMMLQLQHFGLLAGFAWLPLALSGVDEAHEKLRTSAVLKIAVASAMCFLAGYTPFWVVFAVCVTTYAAARRNSWRVTAAAAGALGFSLGLCAVQLLPAMEASGQMVREPRYGSGIQDPGFFISHIAPNFYDFALNTPVQTNLGKEYLYLGAAGLTGLLLALTGRPRAALAPLVMGAVAAVFVTNPFQLLSAALDQPSVLSQVVRDWYFLGGITAAVAALSAIGFDWYFRSARRTAPAWVSWTAIVLVGAWCIRLAIGWNPRGPGFATGPASFADGAIGVALTAVLVWAYSGTAGRMRVAVGIALLTLTAADYKAFGTSKRLNADAGPGGASVVNAPFEGMDDSIYRRLRDHSEYRLALDEGGPMPAFLRHTGLATPQGFDPLLPKHYRTLIERHAKFRTDREFELESTSYEAFRLLGVRYYITAEQAPQYKTLSSDARYRLLEPSESYFKTYELLDAQPAFGLEGKGTAQNVAWTPERRAFEVASEAGGRFRLSEQFYPGWRASVDGSEVAVERCHDAFQCIAVPAGSHRVEFVFRSDSLRSGAAGSAACWLLLGLAWWKTRRQPGSSGH